ncbi:MAG: hypothetical protein IPM24_23775 [Bryobacterales bacterium]|nr:hypothetical protein [Bryobacterales bacterium]
MLPPTVRIKLSTEAAGTAAITPVVMRDIPTRELVEQMLCLTGKDPQRIAGLLRRGTLVRGGSRYRWQGWDADPANLEALLATFPDPDPGRPFDAPLCIRAILREGSRTVELTAEAGRKRRVFRRDCFWDVLMRVAAASPPRYAGYSYGERADRYLADLTLEQLAELHAAAGRLAHTSLRSHVMAAAFDSVELYATRD